MKKIFSFFAAAALAACNNTPAEDPHAGHDHDHEAQTSAAEVMPPRNGRVFFGNLMDGDTVTSPFKVMMGVEGMRVQPAGELVDGTGHHHILLGSDSIARGTVVPADSLNIHYGQGQTETELNLPPGKHTISLQFANGYHQSYGSQMSASVTVYVK